MFWVRDRNAEMAWVDHCGIRYKCPVPLLLLSPRHGVRIFWRTVLWMLGLGNSPGPVPIGNGPFLLREFPTLASYTSESRDPTFE
jgi:hypothetical protein